MSLWNSFMLGVNKFFLVGRLKMGTPLKIVVIGNSGVGKSALCIQYVQHFFVEDLYPTIEDFYTKRAVVNGVNYTLEVIDTSAVDEFSILRRQSIENADGVLHVFSLGDGNSIESIETDIHLTKRIKDVPVVLVGNKLDVSINSAVDGSISEMAAFYRIPYVKTSAKTAQGVEDAFSALVGKILAQKMENVSSTPKHCCTLL